MEETITQNLIGDYPVELGMGIDIRQKSRSLFQCVKPGYLRLEGMVRQNIHEGGSSTTHQITTSNKEAALAIAGSLEI